MERILITTMSRVGSVKFYETRKGGIIVRANKGALEKIRMGLPICSDAKGYYTETNKDFIQEMIGVLVDEA